MTHSSIPNPGKTTEFLESVKREYADDSSLNIRYLTHQRYTVDPVDFVEWTLGCLKWRGDERVVDVGCGPGDLLRALARRGSGWGRLAGLDFSPGMAHWAAGLSRGLPIRFLAADAQALPFTDGTFDVVMARHMLYYVPNIDRAMAEAARLLNPGGRFLATANSIDTMPELLDYYRAVQERFPGVFEPWTPPEVQFSLETGPAFIAAHFGRVETHLLPGTLRFPAAKPFIDYVTSGQVAIVVPGHEAEVPAAIDWLTAQVEARIARHGHFDVTKIAGAIVGVKED